MKLHRPSVRILAATTWLGALPFAHAASGDSAPFVLDTRNFSGSAAHTVHTDKRAYLATDSVPGSLRQAIANAAAGEAVDFDPGLSSKTITLGGSSLTIGKDLTIDASGLGGGVIVDGNDSSRVFTFGPGITNRLSGFTIRNGNANWGGGINNSGDLTLDHMKLLDNHSGTLGGAIRHYDGRLTLNDTTVSGNSASEGGGIHVENNSTGPDSVILNSTTLSGNTATNRGGGIFQNVATSIEINHCTLADNAANQGGGLFTTGINSSLVVSNSIVAANTASTSPDIHYNSGTITPAGINLIGDNSSVGAYFAGDGTFIGTSGSPLTPRLAPLGDYGGPTQTMPPLPGSPAIEGAVLLGSTPATDQRGNARPSGPLPDIGAVEAGSLLSGMLADTDNDGIPDVMEGPGGPYPHLTVGVDDRGVDTDGDGSTDAEELLNMTDPLDPNDLFKILVFALAPGYDAQNNPLVSVTISTFPGFLYELTTGETLDNMQVIPDSAFTATDYTTSFEILLGTGSERTFLRAQLK